MIMSWRFPLTAQQRCGRHLYGDFHELKEGAIKKLRDELESINRRPNRDDQV